MAPQAPRRLGFPVIGSVVMTDIKTCNHDDVKIRVCATLNVLGVEVSAHERTHEKYDRSICVYRYR